MIRSVAYLLMAVLLLALPACTGMRYITEGDPLFIGHEVNFINEVEGSDKLQPVVKSVLKPKPNHRTLWMRPALARYNMLSDSARVKKFWKNKISEPVLLSDVQPDVVSTSLHYRIFNRGYFINTVSYDTVFVGKRKAKYQYNVTLGEPYKIESITFPKPNTPLTKEISETQSETLLHPGDIYTLDALKSERGRIDKELKDSGYIYFSPDFILLKADSVTGEHQVRVDVTVKPETPPESKTPFTIRRIFIYDDHVLEGEEPDTFEFDRYYLITRNQSLNIKALQEGIFLKPGELYSHSNHMQTIRYMNELPIIRNANIKFSPVDSLKELDAVIYLAQRKRFAYTAEFNTVFRSTNYFGPGVIFSYSDRNANTGAELLNLNARASFEMQIVDGKINPAYELGLGVSYNLPRFYPRLFYKSIRKSLPKTTISAGYTLFNRLDLYRLNAATVNLRYSWSKTDRMQHSFYPLEVSYTRLPEDSKSDEFNDYLEENPGVQRSFDEQFVVSLGYDFTYRSAPGRRNEFYFNGGIDMAGMLLDLLYTATDAQKDTLGRYHLFGVPFSQYIRPQMDIVNSYRLNEHSNIVTRFSTGVGIPIGNSSILPYIKQFYVGGTNSLRSFIARSVGPGSEIPPEGYNDLTGDIRLEGNVEYRFDLAGSLKGALFMDAGNIWLFSEDPTRPKGTFHLDTFMDEIAISTGWGLRWDFDFIVARLDFAYTVRTPYLPEGERWAEGFKFWEPALSFAIGYPF